VIIIGVRLTAIFDSCHSGSVLDLPFNYSTRGVIKESLKGNTQQRLRRRKNIETKGSPADIIMFSGCKDTQSSDDTKEAGQAIGAMTYAFIKS
jgi:metacaspase-1